MIQTPYLCQPAVLSPFGSMCTPGLLKDHNSPSFLIVAARWVVSSETSFSSRSRMPLNLLLVWRDGGEEKSERTARLPFKVCMVALDVVGGEVVYGAVSGRLLVLEPSVADTCEATSVSAIDDRGFTSRALRFSSRSERCIWNSMSA